LNSGEPCAAPGWASSVASSSLNTALFTHDGAAARTFGVPAAELDALDRSKEYTLCYKCYATGSYGRCADGSGYQDSYIRWSVSSVGAIKSHKIKHPIQGQIANSEDLVLSYEPSVSYHTANQGSGKGYLALVDETYNNYKPCTGATSPGSSPSSTHSGPSSATSASGTGYLSVDIDTDGLDTDLNFAVCFAETTSGPWTDSGVRTSVSRVTELEYNKQTSTGQASACAFTIPDDTSTDKSNCYISQQGTVNYARQWPSTNKAPASDTFPLATNRIPVFNGLIDLQYNGDLPDAQAFVIVKDSLNSDNNPCASQCGDSNACKWSVTAGVNANKDTARSGVVKAADSTKIVRIDQTGTNKILDAGETFAVCYAQIDSVDGDTLSTVDGHTFRDSYIRLKPSKVLTLAAYGVDHFTFGDIPSKKRLAVSVTGSIGSTQHLSLVDASSNSNQPCTDTIANVNPAGFADSMYQTTSGRSHPAAICPTTVTSAEAKCDVNMDGVYDEQCAPGTFCDMANDGCGSGAANTLCTKQGAAAGKEYNLLSTEGLNSDTTYAVCYTENWAASTPVWVDSGIRVKTPQVQSITYGSPARVIDADACFTGVPGLAAADADGVRGVADCHTVVYDPSRAISDSHMQIGAMLPRASDVQLTYQGPYTVGSYGAGTGMAEDKTISLVEQSLTTTAAEQHYNPCRIATQAFAAPDSTGGATDGYRQDQGDNANVADTEGGMRLHSGPLTATGSTRAVTIPAQYDEGSDVYNYLDYTKTYAVCYTDGNAGNADQSWRDSYIRVTLSKIKTLDMIHTGNPGSRIHVSTIGTFTNVPSLEVEWDGSLLHNQWLRFTVETKNKQFPCDKSQHALTLGSDTTESISSLSASRRITFDTSNVANPTQVTGYFAVCYATGAGDGSDTTWHDSSIRLRFVRWSNPAKHRVVTGAPARLTFAVSTGRWQSDFDKVVFLKDKTDCRTAPSAVVTSDGNQAKRGMEYICSKVDTSDRQDKCDSDFDGTFSDTCVVGALCEESTANAATNGGCGGTGVCTGAVQLPSGKSYHEQWDLVPHEEEPFNEGTYAICVCLGSPFTGTAYPATSSSYGPANGNGGCDDANEFTLVFSSLGVCTSIDTDASSHCDTDHDGTYDQQCVRNARCSPTNTALNNGGCGTNGDCDTGVTLKVIPEPKLGRHQDANGQLTLRHVAGMNHQYGIKSHPVASGFNVEDGDRIYFAPPGLGCGHVTKYSGEGTHTYKHGEYIFPWTDVAAKWVSVGVDRRWRAMVTTICITVGGTNIGTNCDANFDGTYDQTCTVGAFCNTAEDHNGGCGSSGACGSPIPAVNAADRTTPLPLTGFSDATNASVFTTPADSYLSTIATMTACFATQESLAGFPTDSTDYVPLTHGLEVIAEPRLGPVDAPTGRIYAVEGSTPTFAVNSMKAQDLYYFVPQIQTRDDVQSEPTCTVVAGPNVGTNCDADNDGNLDDTCAYMAVCNPANANNGGCGDGGKCSAGTFAANANLDCTPNVCTVVSGSNIGSNCDADHDGAFDDTCVFMARCNPANTYNGGCGTGGTCTQQVPTISTSSYTGLIEGANFISSPNSGQLLLPALSVPPVEGLPTAWYMAACMIPAGAQKDLPSNVKQLSDLLVVFKEPTDALVTSWFQYQVHELKFTQPQQGVFEVNLATGLPGDIVVLQKDNCNQVHAISTAGYKYDQSPLENISWESSATSWFEPLQGPDWQAGKGQLHSAKFTLEEMGNITQGDEKGGVAQELPLATGKVNELSTGVYKICYATMSSGGESQTDYKELTRTLEILPTPATMPSISAPRSLILGQDIVVSWASNIGLQERDSVTSSWLGLFEKDSCPDTHECHVAYQFISSGDESGTVIFSQSDYKNSGDYEVRYFKGDTRNGQGVVCRGQPGVPTETYMMCTLETAAISEGITVAGQDIDETEDLALRPGLEAVFGHGNRGRYHRTKLT